MAVFTGNNGAIFVNSVALAQVKQFSLDVKSGTIETTVMGKETKTFVKGMAEWSGSADVLFDDTTWSGGTAIAKLNGTAGNVGDASVAAKFYIDYESGAPADTVFQGNIIVTGYSIKAAMDGMVEATVSFQGSGDNPLTFSTGTNVTP